MVSGADSAAHDRSMSDAPVAELDAARCYRAFVSHDRRFDGRVFGGVVTTGVYCRPVCPVRPAKIENSRFFACAAAAEAAGFRPCLRCRPETAPGTPAWMGTSAVVARALRLIADGRQDDADVEALAARVGLGARQLRRLFARHLGASPMEIARARRVHFARTLIDQTDLSMTEVALSAGFHSIRQFNHAIRATFRAAPTALRRKRRAAPANGGGVVLRLPYRPPFAWNAILDVLRAGATPGVEAVGEDTYRRTIEINGATGLIAVSADPREPQLLLRVELPDSEGLMQIVERVRRLFDLDADPHEIASHLGRSPLLRPLVSALPGLRIPGTWDPFELAVRAILGQQVSVHAATKIAGRLACAFGDPVAVHGAALSRLFPQPARLAAADLSRIGIAHTRAATIRTLASAVAGGDLLLDASRGLDDTVARLSAIPGLDTDTAHFIALRACAEPDAFPCNDVRLRRAASGGSPLTATALARLAEAWRPWRGYAAMYLWTA